MLLTAKGRERERRIHFSIKEWNKYVLSLKCLDYSARPKFYFGRGDIVANWKELKNTKRVRQLIWKGIPPRTRETVWPLALGNNLNINGGRCAAMTTRNVKGQKYSANVVFWISVRPLQDIS